MNFRLSYCHIQLFKHIQTVVDVKPEFYLRSFDRRSGPGHRASVHYVVTLERPAFPDYELCVDQGLTLYKDQQVR